MKQGKLIRRAVSAALAGCMMFTLSAPALAESTDALMQLSMTRRSAVSVLDAENSGTDANASVATKYGITIEIYGKGEVEVDSDNCNNILGFLKYDPNEKKLTLLDPSADAVNYLTIDAPNTDVVLESTNMIVNFNLLIENARSVKVSSTGSWAPVYGKVFIYCACPVTLEHTGAGINHGVAISGIEFAAPVSASDFVYYTSDAPDATPTDAGTGTIPANTVNYLHIVPKVSYTITTADDATITVDGKAVTSVHEGEKVTVTAAGRENAEFTGWTAEGITLTKEQKANPTVTFTMPGNNVTLTPNYNVVQDYGIEVGSENTTPTRVTSKNCKDILNKGVLSYDPTTQTLKSNGKLPRSLQKINAPGKDINLDGKDQIAVAAKLIVVDAHNVTISSNKFAAIFARDDTSTIDCTGKVDIRSGGDVVVNGNLSINNLGDVDLYANGNSISNKALTITSGGNVTIESTDGRAAKNLTINKAENVTITISDDERAVSENTDITASGTVILKNNAPGGHVGTVDFTQADGKKYVYYTSEAEDAKLIDPRIHPLPDTVESSYLRIEPRETYYSITVANGTAQVGDDTTGRITTAFEGETVTVKAKAPTDEDAAKGCKWFGQTICPRELHIKDGRILQTPVRELDAVHGKRTFHENVTVQGETSLEGIKGRVADLTVTVQPGEYRSFTLKLAADADHHTSLTYDPYTSELTLDRSYAGSRADIVHRRSCKVRSQNGALKLRILLDKNSIEVFANDGEQTMTAWIYTPQSADGITFAADGKATVTVEQFELNL